MKTKIASFVKGMAIGLCLVTGIFNLILGFFYSNDSWQGIAGVNQLALAAALMQAD